MDITIERTKLFTKWVGKLKDPKAKAAILSRVQKLKQGLYGDAEPVGEGVTELRVHVGKGYRVYLKHRESRIIVILCGGNKKTQKSDIKLAKAVAKQLGI
ncbi:type II toxin-antitoxin system RelE/ParE family toxin [Vibrio vulnificus]|uniref:type II toxin-antitoxin system RelE/ParE family toxin n=1 Tax=Vibrio vulnificus TaxID=672 RepID=UPI003241EA3F